MCSCRDGRRLLRDGYRCVNVSPLEATVFNCSTDQFRCSNAGCIPYKNTCDGIVHCTDKSDEDPKYCGMLTLH